MVVNFFVEELEYEKKTRNLLEVNYKLYHLKLYRIYIATNSNQNPNFSFKSQLKRKWNENYPLVLTAKQKIS